MKIMKEKRNNEERSINLLFDSIINVDWSEISWNCRELFVSLNRSIYHFSLQFLYNYAVGDRRIEMVHREMPKYQTQFDKSYPHDTSRILIRLSNI